MEQKNRQKILKTTNLGPDGQKIIKTKKSRALLTQTKKKVSEIFFSREFFFRTISLTGQFFCPDNFLSGQKDIYHQGEFRQMSRNIFMLRKTQCKKTYFLEGNECAP